MIEAPLGGMARIFGQDEAANGRSLACVWAFGASCLAATIVLPHPSRANDLGLAVIVAIAYPVAALMFVRASTLPAEALEATTYLGQLLITALSLFWGAPDPPFLWFHIWLVVHSFHFLAPARATMQIACAAVLFVVATVATRAPFPAATAVVGVGSILTIGLLVGAFRRRVDGLVAALAHSAATDPLTGLANRRAFAEAYDRERARRARFGSRSALLVLDCDGFKTINDLGGHGAGDRALRRVARMMSESIREVDTPARLGGDEFAVLLTAPEHGAAFMIGQRIRRAVAADPESHGVTLSIGIVELPADAAVDLDTALAMADRAMYASKDRGGDCVSVGTFAAVAAPVGS